MNTASITVVKSMRPPFLVLTPVCIFLGMAIAEAYAIEIDAFRAILILLAALSAHISVNSFNEYFDFRSGLDNLTNKTPFSGGSGGLPAHPHAAPLVLATAISSLLLTSAIGLFFVIHGNALLLPLGVLGLFTIVSYTSYINKFPWLCLIAPGFAFGPLFIVGTLLAITPLDSAIAAPLNSALVASLVPFFLVNNLLLLNQFPDVDADRQVGRVTLPIRYGLPFSLNIYRLFSALCALTIIVAAVLGLTPWLSLLAIAPLTLSFSAQRDIANSGFEHEQMIPGLGKNVACTLLTIFVYALAIYMGHIQ